MMARALLPHVLAMLSDEARRLIVAVVELAQGADEIGYPTPPQHVADWCRELAGDRLPWQLVAAAIAGRSREDVTADRVHELAAAVLEHGMIGGVVEWCDGDREAAGTIVLTFLLFSARELDAGALETVGGAFRNAD